MRTHFETEAQGNSEMAYLHDVTCLAVHMSNHLFSGRYETRLKRAAEIEPRRSTILPLLKTQNTWVQRSVRKEA